jgi:hypothetical protein
MKPLYLECQFLFLDSSNFQPCILTLQKTSGSSTVTSPPSASFSRLSFVASTNLTIYSCRRSSLAERLEPRVNVPTSFSKRSRADVACSLPFLVQVEYRQSSKHTGKVPKSHNSVSNQTTHDNSRSKSRRFAHVAFVSKFGRPKCV